MIRVIENLLRRCFNVSVVVVTVLAFSLRAGAEVINVKSAVVRTQDDAYVMDAEFDFALTAPLEEALVRGTPLYFVLETDVTRNRPYWFDEHVPSPS